MEVNTTNKIQGFVYVTAQKDPKLFETSVGYKYIKADDQPPYIVVDHALDSVLVTKWPGRLLKVEVLNQANEKEINQGLVKNIWYSRTLGVEILDELPISELFNPGGIIVVKILDFASTMNDADADCLAQFDISKAHQIYSDTWNAWLKTKDPSSIHLNNNHFDTLAILPKNSRRTLNNSFSVIANLVWDRAKEVLGEAAFTRDEEDEFILKKSRAHARSILTQAAMAHNAAAFISEENREILLAPWSSIASKS